MATIRTEKSRYPSRYSPDGWVTAAQYIVEYTCEKKAKREKKELPTKFWNLPEWQKFYKSQIHTANQLVKKWGEAVVIAAVKNKEASWMYSLRAPGFEQILLIEKKNKIVKEQILEKAFPLMEDPNVDVNAKPREIKKDNLGDRLDG